MRGTLLRNSSQMKKAKNTAQKLHNPASPRILPRALTTELAPLGKTKNTAQECTTWLRSAHRLALLPRTRPPQKPESLHKYAQPGFAPHAGSPSRSGLSTPRKTRITAQICTTWLRTKYRPARLAHLPGRARRRVAPAALAAHHAEIAGKRIGKAQNPHIPRGKIPLAVEVPFDDQ